MTCDVTPDFSRRRFLSGRQPVLPKTPPPPWAVSEFKQRCTQCGVCVECCPEQVLFVSEEGFPAVDFQRGECTFCERCVTVCEPDALALSEQPWRLKAQVSESCLLHQQVECRRCADSCPERVISFPWLGPGRRSIELDLSRCTGCGACVAGCPVSAIKMTAEPKESDRE